MCARFGRGSAVVVCARRCACRLDVANIHRHAHHSSRRGWSCGATWSDMKRTCATCHEYSWHAPFVSSNSMVVVTNGGHSRPSRHSSPRAPFCTVIGADWAGGSSAHRACEQHSVLKLGCYSEVVATNRGHFARGSLSHFCARLSLSLSRVLPSSKSEHHATNSSLPLIHHLQALRTGSLGLVSCRTLV